MNPLNISKTMLALACSAAACATVYAQPTARSAPTSAQVPGVAPMGIATPTGGLSAAVPAAQIAGKLDVANVLTVAGETVKLHAVLSRAGTQVNGASLQFRVDGASVGQGVTDATGATDVPYKLVDSLTLGAHTIVVMFPGDNKTRETAASAKLTVLKSTSSLTMVMEGGSIRGLLRGASDKAYLGNRKLVIKRDGATAGTVNTDSYGGYEFKYGSHFGSTFLVEFEGETSYLGTTKTAVLPLPQGLGPHINTQFVKP